jgi:hypothetical protein
MFYAGESRSATNPEAPDKRQIHWPLPVYAGGTCPDLPDPMRSLRLCEAATLFEETMPRKLWTARLSNSPKRPSHPCSRNPGCDSSRKISRWCLNVKKPPSLYL